MRQIGALSHPSDAQRLAGFLTAQGISAHAEKEGDGWAVWVRDEDSVDEARRELERFRVDPNDARYAGAERTAERKRRDEARRREEAQRNLVEMRGRWQNPSLHRRPCTFMLAGVALLVGLGTNFGDLSGNQPPGAVMRYLSLWNPAHALDPGWQGKPDVFVDIKAGQAWRLVTPIFIHYGILHFVFNAFWLVSLGGMIENRYGWLWMLFLTLAVAVPSNFLEGAMATRPVLPGGLSGVVYGFFGYAWMKSLFDRESGIYVPGQTVVILLGWLVFCMAPFAESVVGPVANWAHGGGLAVGVILGAAPLMLRPQRGG